MESSMIRSVLSIDGSKKDLHVMSQYDLSMEVNRLTRRNSLLQRSKQVLQEEVALYKEEIQSKNRRIQQLTLQQDRHTFPIAQTETLGEQTNDYSSLQVIFFEKEEQINYITALLKEKTSLLSELIQENRHLKEQLSSKNQLITRIKESKKAQMDNQANQIHELQLELQERWNQIESTKIFYQNLTQKEIVKSNKMQQYLKQKLKLVQEEKQSIISEQQTYSQQRQSLKQQNQHLFFQIQKQKQTIKWLHSLLQQAKGQFINVQLKQQQKIEKEQRQKRQYQKRNKLLKTQLKNYKKDTNSNDTTICQPNKSTRTASSTFTVTPFRINSKHSRFSGSDDPQ